MEIHALFEMALVYPFGETRGNRAAERPCCGLDNVDRKPLATQNRCKFHSDKPAADDRDPGAAICAGENCLRIRVGAEIQRQPRAGAC